MENNSLDKKTSLKNWLIKFLLTKESTREEILSYIATNPINENPSSLEDNNENNLINNILNLDDTSVEDVMVPRAEIISIEQNQDIQEIYNIIEQESHSRMPVYQNNLDNVLGFLHVKDLIKHTPSKVFKIDNILREVLYVAPKSPILDLLKRMRSSRIHMGLVVDEFGGVNGLVTIEDLVEEIVGEIEDEHDADDEEELVKKIDNNKIIVKASYKIIELEKQFNIKIDLKDEEEIDTVGGLLFFMANKVPKNNQIFSFKNILKFRVINASPRRIESLEITKIE